MRPLLLAGALLFGVACGDSTTPGGTGSGGTGAPDGGLADGGTGGSAADAGLDAGPSGLVSIALSQTDVHIPVGANTAFAVTGTFSDGSRSDVTTQASARSTNTSVATVEVGPGSQIQIRAVAQGTASVVVTVGGLQQTAAVTVTAR